MRLRLSRRTVLPVLLAGTSFLSCVPTDKGGGVVNPPPPPPVRVAQVVVSPAAANLLVGGQGAQFTATLTASDGRVLTDRTVTWTSANPAVASVSNAGLVTAVGAGTSAITATAEGVAGIATVTVTVDPCQQFRALALGQTANGALSATDCRLSDNTAVHFYQFTVTALTTVEILMASSQVDPYLLLANSANVLVDQDDDGGGGTSARILRELPPGRYTLYANTFAEREYGNYSVTLRLAPTACTTTRPLTVPGVSSQSLTAVSSCRRNDGTYEDRYAVTVATRTTVALSMVSSAVDAVLTVLDGKQAVWGTDDDSGEGLNAQLEVTLEPGSYTVLASGYPGETGAYRLEARAVVDPCATFLPIVLGSSVTGTISRSDCGFNDGAGGPTYFAKRYLLSLVSAARVQMDLTSTTFDTYLILQNAAGTVIDENDDVSSTSTNSRLTANLAAGQYVINTTSFDPDKVGAFGLAVTAITTTNVGITVAPTSASLQAGQTQQITATVSGTTNTAVTWSSSAAGVATVSTTGLVRALTAGTAVITATAVADPSKTAAVAVTVTAPTASVNLDIAAVYLVQVTQQLDGRVPLVAGRDAVARVFVRGSRAGLTAVPVRLRVYDGTTLLTTLNGTATPTTTVDESCCSANLVVPGSAVRSNLRVLADVDPNGAVAETNEADNAFPVNGTPMTVTVRTVPAMNIRFLHVLQRRSGARGTATTGMVEALRAFWPLNTVNADVRSSVLSIDYALDAANIEGWIRLVRDVETARRADGFNGYYYGVLTYRSTSGVLGLANGIPARSAIGIDETTPFGAREGQLTFVHEMGHTLGLRHAPCGGAAGPEPTFPFSDGRTGNWGMNTTVSPPVLMPPTRTDVMGYCDNQWVGAFNYRRVMDYRQSNPNGSGLKASTEVLLVNGAVQGSALTLDAALSVTAPPDADDPKGALVLEGFDRGGRRLFMHRFTPYRVDDAGDGSEAFVVNVPLPQAQQAQLVRLAVRDGRTGRSAAARAGESMLATDARVEILRDGSTTVSWPDGVRPVTYVRDRTSGHIVGVSREGTVQLPPSTPADGVELLVSNGVKSMTYRVDRVAKRLRQ